MESWAGMRLAFRKAIRNPGMAISATLILALGLGANATTFALLNHVLFSAPEHVDEPGQLSILEFRYTRTDGATYSSNRATYPLAEYLVSTLPAPLEAALEAHWWTGFGLGGESEEVNAVLVSPNYLSLLGVAPAWGSAFGDDRPSRRAVLLSHGFWRRRYGGDPSTVGATCWIANQSSVIVGVMPAGFKGLGHHPVDVWLPIESAANDVWNLPQPADVLGSTYQTWVQVVVRADPRVSRVQLAAAVSSLASAASSLSDRPVTGARAVSLAEFRSTNEPSEGLEVWGAAISFLALLAACANVANLVLLSNLHRSWEIAVRRQLGASNRDLARQLLLESLPLSLASGLLAVGFAAVASSFFSTLLLGERLSLLRLLDWRVVLFMLAAAVFTTLLAGLLPAFGLSRASNFDSLRADSGQVTGPPGQRLPRVLVVSQVALAVIVLVAASAFWKSFHSASGTDLGFEVQHSLIVDVPGLERLGYSESRVRWIFDELARVAGGVPGVRSTSLASSVPWQSMRFIGVEAAHGDPGVRLGAFLHVVSDGYFSDFGIPLRAGREFEETDLQSSEPLAIVNQALASRLWPSSPALGQCLYMSGGSPCFRVIGLAKDTAMASRFDDVEPQVYLPLRPGFSLIAGGSPFLPRALVLRTTESSGVAARLRRALEGSSAIPYLRIRTGRSLVAEQFNTWRKGKWLFTALSVIVLLISGTGLYAQLSFWAARRKHEIGVRLALGAVRSTIVRLLLRHALLITAPGLLAGLLASLGLMPSLRSLVYGVKGADPVVLLSVALVLGGATVVSSLISSWLILRSSRPITDYLRDY